MKKKHFYAAVILFSFVLAGTQPALATKYIPSDTTIGTWDNDPTSPTYRTFTLTTDVTETIQIDENNLTLDGSGHTVTGSGLCSVGVCLNARSNVIIQNLTVTGFQASAEFWIGIALTNSTNITLINNTLSNNNYGIRLYNCDNNFVENNTLSSNTLYGIRLENGSNDNTLTNNTISYNLIGIRILGGSNNNDIYNNNVINNTLQACVTGSSNNEFNWDNPTGGNYWSDWTTPDADGDGFVDNLYPIYDKDENLVAQDDFPWTVQDGWSAPVNQPPVADAGDDQTDVECACQTLGGTPQVTLNGSGYDPDADPLTYHWTGPFEQSPASGPNPTVTLDPGCRGNYEISLVVNDGHVDSEEDTVIITVVDTTPPDVSHPGDLKIEAMRPDGVPIDDEQIQTFLAGVLATDNCDPVPTITNDAPAVFPPGDTIVTFTATDAEGNTSTCESTVTVVEAAEEHLRIIPKIIKREGRLERISAVIRFPKGTTEEDIDIGQPLMLYPGDSSYDIQATRQRIILRYRRGTLRVSVFASFSKDEVTAAVPENGPVEMMVVGRFVSGQYFYGIDTVRIISWNRRR